MMVFDFLFFNLFKFEIFVECFDFFFIFCIVRGLCLYCICYFSGRFFYFVGYGLMWEFILVLLSFC